MQKFILSLKILSAMSFAILSAACNTLVPISQTGNPNEYVVVERDTGPFSNIASTKEEATRRAIEHCKNMDKQFVEKYSIDRPRNFGQFPDATLFFTCVSK